MAAIDFKFEMKKKKAADGKDMPEEKPEMESPEEETGEYTKAQLGKSVMEADKSGDPESLYEAIMKLVNATPTDA